MSKPVSFGTIPSLSTTAWSYEKMKKEWKWQGNRITPAETFSRFIQRNSAALEFLGITANPVFSGRDQSLELVTSKYIGAVPIASPMDGKPVGDLCVVGRFGEDATELLTLLQEDLQLDFRHDMPLVQNTTLQTPLYMECCRFVDLYPQAQRLRWRKFDSVIRTERVAAGGTLWGEYAQRIARDPTTFNQFVNRRNIISTDHDEWHQLNYVLGICLDELSALSCPQKVRFTYYNRLSELRRLLLNSKKMTVRQLHIRNSDPAIIKQLKISGNKILYGLSSQKVAWRLDYTEFFERYVQYLFREACRRKGAKLITNPHIAARGAVPTWGLNYLEPDLICKLGDDQLIVDAKYKSHLLNWSTSTAELKETFRHDLHQVLAYSAFARSEAKQAALVYPATEIVTRTLRFDSPYSGTSITVHLIGIPIAHSRLRDTIAHLATLIGQPEN